MINPRFLVISRTRFPPGLKLAGEIDRENASLVTDLLDGNRDAGTIHVDVTNLNFCDVSGVWAFVTAANHSTVAGRLVLHGMPEQLERTLRLVGWGDLLGLSSTSSGPQA